MNRELTIPMVLRAEELSVKADLSYAAIARVLALDYKRPVNPGQVQHALRKRGMQRMTRKYGRPFTKGDNRMGHGRQRI